MTSKPSSQSNASLYPNYSNPSSTTPLSSSSTAGGGGGGGGGTKYRTWKIPLRPFMYFGIGCYGIALFNLYWERGLKEDYMKWYDLQSRYWGAISALEEKHDKLNSSSSSAIKNPMVHYPKIQGNTDSELVYQYVKMLYDEYGHQNKVIAGDTEKSYSSVLQEKVENQLIVVEDSLQRQRRAQIYLQDIHQRVLELLEDEEELKDNNTERESTRPSLVLLDQQRVSRDAFIKLAEDEKKAREQLLDDVDWAPFYLIDKSTNEYRFQTLTAVKLGLITQFSTKGWKWSPIALLVLASFYFEEPSEKKLILPKKEEKTEKKEDGGELSDQGK